MIGKTGLGNRGLEPCMGVKTEPSRSASGVYGVCRSCGKVIKLRRDGLVGHHGKMVGAIWCPSKQAFREV